MADCEDYDNWDDLDEEERLAALSEAINEHLTEGLYAPVSVRHAPTDNLAYTDDETGDITLSESYLSKAGRNDAYSTAFHEAWHVMDLQDGYFLSDDYAADFNYRDYTTEPYTDLWNESRQDYRFEMPEHDMAEAFGEAMADAIAEECVGPPLQKPPPDPAYSSEPWDFSDINWDAIATPDDSANESDDMEFEIDEDNVVVTEESASEFDDIEFEMDEDNVVVTDDYSASELDDLEGDDYEEDAFEETLEDFQKKITDMDLEIDIENAAVSPDNSQNESDEAESEIIVQNVVVYGEN